MKRTAINPAAVRAYLARDLRDGHRAKRFTRGALEEKCRRFDAKFHTRPYDHQLVCFLLGITYPGYLFLLDMGLGKTKIMLDVIEWRRWENQIESSLVLVPGTANIGAWIDEAEIHQPELHVVGLKPSMSPEEKYHAATKADLDVLVATYAGWQSLVTELTATTTTTGKKKNKMKPPKGLTPPEMGFDLVVYDEITALKNAGSLTFSLARRLRRTAAPCRYFYGLTGTPFDKDPTDLWSQFLAVDGGDTLGGTLSLFRAAFMREKQGRYTIEYTFRKKLHDELHRMMRHRSIRYAARDCLDLPEAIPMRRSMFLPAETLAYHDRLVQDMIDAHGKRQLIENAYIRLRQLSAGWMQLKDEEDGDHLIKFKDNPKIDALLAILGDEIPADEKAIVWNVYHVTGDIICAALTKAGIPHERLYGKTTDKIGAVDRWKTDPDSRVLVASKSGSKGLNLQVANHCIFYETFDSAIDRSQAEARIVRDGQTRQPYQWDLVAQRSIDVKILASLREGKNLFDALIDGDPRELLAGTGTGSIV